MKKIGNVVVIGGSGMVGRELLKVMKRHELEPKKLVITGLTTVGQKEETPYGEIEVQPTNLNSCRSADLVFLAAGADVSSNLAYHILGQERNARLIDLSSAFRYESDVPLVIYPINGDVIGDARLIATPNCTTSIALMVLSPLHQIFPLTRINLVSYQASSGAGKEALDALESQIEKWADCGNPPKKGTTASHQYPLAGNLIPHIDVAEREWEGYTKEEMKCMWEMNKILFRRDINDRTVSVTATCVRVPVRRCHCMVLTVSLEKTLSSGAVRSILSSEVHRKYVQLIDNVRDFQYPMPLNMEGKEEVGVGRIRACQDQKELVLWVCGDQLLRGAALSAVEIAENIF